MCVFFPRTRRLHASSALHARLRDASLSSRRCPLREEKRRMGLKSLTRLKESLMTLGDIGSVAPTAIKKFEKFERVANDSGGSWIRGAGSHYTFSGFANPEKV